MEINELEMKLGEHPRDWVIKEIVAENQALEKKAEELLRWKVACVYLGRHGRQEAALLTLARLMVSTMSLEDVERYAETMRVS